MRENTAAMTLVMTVVTALAVGLDPAMAPNHSGVRAERVILSLPWKESFSAQPASVPETATGSDSKTNPVLPETAGTEEPNPESGIPSTGVLASRSGQAPARKPSYTEEDLYWLARVISSEAKGESMEGQIAVGAVVMNRLRDPRFPKTVKEVVLAQGQFDPVRFGAIGAEPAPSAVEAAKRALQGENPVPEALYFYNPNTATDQWIRSLRVIKRIGNHAFAAVE